MLFMVPSIVFYLVIPSVSLQHTPKNIISSATVSAGLIKAIVLLF